MATYEYSTLLEKYENFTYPFAVIKIAGKDIASNENQLTVDNVDITLSCGYEANIATFEIGNCFETYTGQFEYDEYKDYVQLGSSVTIALGYSTTAESVFAGVITKVSYHYNSIAGTPVVRVTCMDVKGIMMAGSYANSLVAYSYGEAVKEILQKTAYSKMQDGTMISQVTVDDTPDKGTYSDQETNDFSIEMVNESDYEFVVKAAKKFNYEFFTRLDTVFFRKARSEDEVQLEINSNYGLFDFDVEYDVTGLVETVEVRGMDTGKGKLIKSSKKFNNTISKGNKAKNLISGSKKIITDATVKSAEDAAIRATAYLENMAYRYGSFTGTTMGIPEIFPGKFIEIVDMGDVISNKFYVKEVRHVLGQNGYRTFLTCEAAELQ